MRRAVLAIGVVSCWLGSGGVGYAAPAQQIRCGTTLTRSATLTHDLTCSAGSGVRIRGRGVTFDLGGHLLAGHLQVTGSHQKVRGGAVASVSISAADTADLSDLRIPGNVGVDQSADVRLTRLEVVDGGVGIGDGGDIEVTDSTFRRSSLSFGVVSGARVAGNRFIDGRVVLDGTPEESVDVLVTDNLLLRGGIELGGTWRVTVQRNHIITAAVGIRVGADSDQYQITDNNIVGATIGVRISANRLAGGENLVSGNWLRDSGIAGLLLTGHLGDRAQVRITHNLAHANGYHSGGARDSGGWAIDDGIHIDLPAGRGATVDHNLTSDNADRGIDAVPGTVLDGGGNLSARDRNGCLGVRCTATG